MPQERERQAPRISVNKLGEYMVATPSRRRTIVREQKKPRDFIVARYTEVYPAITEFLVSGGTNFVELESTIDRLNAASATTEWQAQDNQLSAEAIEAFLDITDSLELSGYRVSQADTDPPQLRLAGMSISVRPELLLQAGQSTSGSTVGAVKLYISKNNPLGAAAAAYVSTTVHQYLTDCLRPGDVPELRGCMVIDVFARQVYPAPRSYKRRRNDIEAACEEIVRAWAAL